MNTKMKGTFILGLIIVAALASAFVLSVSAADQTRDRVKDQVQDCDCTNDCTCDGPPDQTRDRTQDQTHQESRKNASVANTSPFRYPFHTQKLSNP